VFLRPPSAATPLVPPVPVLPPAPAPPLALTWQCSSIQLSVAGHSL